MASFVYIESETYLEHVDGGGAVPSHGLWKGIRAVADTSGLTIIIDRC